MRSPLGLDGKLEMLRCARCRLPHAVSSTRSFHFERRVQRVQHVTGVKLDVIEIRALAGELGVLNCDAGLV